MLELGMLELGIGCSSQTGLATEKRKSFTAIYLSSEAKAF
jgi:hypothetical protein